VRVVFPDGNTEVLPTLVGVRKAKELGLDLVLVSPSADPPVCKVIDYGEFTYQEKKKKSEAKKKQHRIEVKEVKFRPNTDEHDYNFKKNHAVRFLDEGNKVKATVFFRGREITHSNLGYKLLTSLIGDLVEHGEPEGSPRMEGRSMHVILGPKKNSPKRPGTPSESRAAAEEEEDGEDAAEQ
jgi:translation initiation factor IF-3